MILFWKIRYFDRNERQLNDRSLQLNTETLDPITKAAVEFQIESRTNNTERGILKYRTLFREGDEKAQIAEMSRASKVSFVFLTEYFEDENGIELSFDEIGKILTGNPNAIFLPSGTEQHDVDLMLAEPKPLPIAEVNLSQEELKLFGYFTRDLRELCGSAFLQDRPATLTSRGNIFSQVGDDPVLETACSDDEIRSFVTIFRRLYMENEPANFLKAVAAFANVVGDHPWGQWVAGVGLSFEATLARTPELRPFIQAGQCTFTLKRLLDVFLYTQYAHQPDERRQRQFGECLNEVQGKKSLLTWLFLTELWKCSLQIGNAGRIIARWFNQYCEHHQVTADVLNSLLHENPGIGSQEKEASRRERLFREKTEELALELWKQNGSPVGGPMQFLHAAQHELGKRTQSEATPSDNQ